MLVLSRKLGEKVVIVTAQGVKVEVVVVAIDRKKVRLGIEADADVRIDRQEVFERRLKEAT